MILPRYVGRETATMMSCKQYQLCWCALPRTNNSLSSGYPRTQRYIARVFCSHARPNVIEPKHHPLSSSSHSSARERRKQRNERREQLKADKSSWREVLEERVLEKKKAAPKGLKYELDMGRLKARGMQWWMVLVASRSEVEMAESISLALSENFPADNFEVFVPIIPTKRKMKDGSISSSTRRLHSGCVFLRAVMSRKVHDVIKKVPRCKGFFGKKVGYHEQIIMPIPVPVEDMDGMFKKIREEEEDLRKIKELAKEDLRKIKELAKEEQKMRHAAKDAIKKVDKKDISEIGSNIRVISGPYANFEGCIVGLPDEDKKVQASIMAFGDVTKVVLGLDEIEINPTSA